jgi:hypothetical protein
MNFEKWLLKQAKRDDIIGDLASDFKIVITNYPEIKTIEESFIKFSPCVGATDAYKKAKKEFEIKR